MNRKTIIYIVFSVFTIFCTVVGGSYAIGQAIKSPEEKVIALEKTFIRNVKRIDNKIEKFEKVNNNILNKFIIIDKKLERLLGRLECNKENF